MVLLKAVSVRHSVKRNLYHISIYNAYLSFCETNTKRLYSLSKQTNYILPGRVFLFRHSLQSNKTTPYLNDTAVCPPVRDVVSASKPFHRFFEESIEDFHYKLSDNLIFNYTDP